MAEYINRDELMENIQRNVSTYGIVTHPLGYIVLGKVYDAIDEIDVVEIVRCGECIHNYGLMHQSEDVPYNKNDIVCGFWSTDGLEEHNYCCFGESQADNE